MDKKSLRKIIRESKNRFTPEQLLQKSEEVIRQLESHPKFLAATHVLAYWSLADEVTTHQFVKKWSQTKQIYLPVMCADNSLEVKRFEQESSLWCGNSFGVCEPQKESLTYPIAQMDLVVVPGMAYDKKGHRLGRGKGYYDRLLSDYKGCKIGICFDFQCVEEVPTEPYDIPMDEVLF